MFRQHHSGTALVDNNGTALAFVYSEEEPERRAAANLMTRTRPGASLPVLPACPSCYALSGRMQMRWCKGDETRRIALQEPRASPIKRFSNPFGFRLTVRIGTERPRGGKNMHKLFIASVGAAGIAIAAMMAPAPANADCVGCAVGAGILGGVAAGALIGSAIANGPPPPPPPAYYGPPPPDEYAFRAECRELRQACIHREELGEEGMGNCRRYREFCR
jgi:hypothetical protein